MGSPDRRCVGPRARVPAGSWLATEDHALRRAAIDGLGDLLVVCERPWGGAGRVAGGGLERPGAAQPRVELSQGDVLPGSAALVSVMMPEDHLRADKLASAGRPVAGTVVSIQDPSGTPLPAGQVGEVCVRGGQFMREYWQRPDETSAAFTGGWYHSGDAGYLDDEGFLFLVDRTKDMIVTGGENVYSTEVEQALASHPAVAQAAVIGIPDDVWVVAVHAVVVLKPEHTVTQAELIEHCRPLIAGYTLPNTMECRAEPLPLLCPRTLPNREFRAPDCA